MHNLLTVIAILSGTRQAADAAGLASLADFRALCRVYNLGASSNSLQLSQTLQTLPAKDPDLENFNLSTAADSFFNHKDGDYDSATTADKAAEKRKWKKANEKKLKHEGEGPNPFARLPASLHRDKANQQIAELIRQRQDLLAQYNQKKQAAEQDLAAAKAALKTAAYGQGKKDFDKAAFASTSNTKRNKICGSVEGGSDTAATNVAHALICICTGENGAAQGECGSTMKATVGNIADGDGGAAGQAWAAIKTACESEHSNLPLTIQTIAAVREAALSRLGALNTGDTAANGAYTFGKNNGNDCDGTAGTKQCVNYKKQLTEGSKTIPWIAQLTMAEQKLTSAQIAAAEAAAIANNIKQITKQANATYKAAAFDIAKGIQSEPSTTSAVVKQGGETNCDNFKKSLTCPTNNCKWEENDGKGECKPKAGPENTAAGTGEGAAGEQKKEEKCNGKDEKTCGSTKGCKWEGTECRVFSFLVNKKFALMAATSVGLVAF
ncbi:Trypanosomal VSG domain [Trypanosoma brucei equiperdum]|uniref:Trypanosomal VSG domain n=1 Tax=Trypanosoma brucei equiperdum TaxID=630700 RepID=A0A3L6KSH1_9TRYP|nr:Trypanosome variant surface glycoprotein [Trypanosoma brucei equiperdum]RHW67364.1 Trypanosomal VSG domain [Trypanosoma brucei equiperdum]RHW67370.1 Trypanosomal VSG domain [Trypanosoma brucei equiperdum]RHW67383.1 Trypanosomal VSG domain [Trypanosoma brucei equiperdum]